ncbi:unnamed protein product [Dovyalis caffra]|uniref:Glutathione transferase n=1 Tax=Dovyalis caffra TaxID=77055 RepID=A0AAV1SCC2_9ROSI|nr:unnamed protein product [Dovyalis caffra]
MVAPLRIIQSNILTILDIIFFSYGRAQQPEPGLDYEYKAVNLAKGEQFSTEFEQLNPLQYVPVLVDGDVVVSDSLAILLVSVLYFEMIFVRTYLEEKYPQKALLPDDPRLKALHLQVASIICSGIQPLHMLALVKRIEEKVGPGEGFLWAQSSIEKGFSALEKLLKDFATRFATGEALYMADMFLAPQIATAVTRFNVDMFIAMKIRIIKVVSYLLYWLTALKCKKLDVTAGCSDYDDMFLWGFAD